MQASALNVEAGDRVEFVEIEPGRFEVIAATRLVEGLTSDQPGFVPLVALVELVWVLSSSYGLNRDQLVEALDLLLRSKEIMVDRADLVLQAQRRVAKGGADFADCLIERIAQAHGWQKTMTFDTGAAKAAGMTLVA